MTKVLLMLLCLALALPVFGAMGEGVLTDGIILSFSGRAYKHLRPFSPMGGVSLQSILPENIDGLHGSHTTHGFK